MTVVVNGRLNIPNVVCVAADGGGGTVAGAQPGQVIYYTDSKIWKIVKDDLSLADYVLPFGASIDIGDVTLLAGTAAIGTVSQTPVLCSTSDVHAPAVNTNAVISYSGDPSQRHVISGIAWSYTGGTPVGGSLQITDGGAVVFIVDIDKSGPGGYEFPRPKMGMATNSAMVITLAAAGAGITGKLSIENHWLV
jgi:hypothetical protein